MSHRDGLLSLMMTSSDLCAICKPWETQKKTAKLIYEEFYVQVYNKLFYDPRKNLGEDIVAGLSVRQSVRHEFVSGPELRNLKSNFTTFSQKWWPYWDDVSRTKFGSLPWRSMSQHDLAVNACPAHYLHYLRSDFTTISQKWSPYWDDVSRKTFGSLPWRSMSQHDFVAKSYPAHNFIWSRILQLFHRNDHHIERNIWVASLKVNVTAWPCTKIVTGP
jgi:hypothetical protein